MCHLERSAGYACLRAGQPGCGIPAGMPIGVDGIHSGVRLDEAAPCILRKPCFGWAVLDYRF